MKNSCLIRCVRNLTGSLKIKETDFVVSTPHSNCQFLILGQFAEATKILIISNDQTCNLCNVGSIVYSISCTPEATDLNLGFDAMRSNLVKSLLRRHLRQWKFHFPNCPNIKHWQLEYGVFTTKSVSLIFKDPIKFPMHRIKHEFFVHRHETAREEGQSMPRYQRKSPPAVEETQIQNRPLRRRSDFGPGRRCFLLAE